MARTMPNIYVRRLDNNEIVHTVSVKHTDPRDIDKVVLGLLRNMNTDRFYVDDSECDREEAST